MTNWSNQSKSADPTWTPQTKHATTWDDLVDFLLQEIGDFLLQESGDKIVLNPSPGYKNNPTWSNQAKH